MNFYSLKTYPIQNLENSINLNKIHSNAKNIKSIENLNPSNLPPDMMHTHYYKNTYAADFHFKKNTYEPKPDIDYGPIYTTPYFSLKETGSSNIDASDFFK